MHSIRRTLTTLAAGFLLTLGGIALATPAQAADGDLVGVLAPVGGVVDTLLAILYTPIILPAILIVSSVVRLVTG